MNPNGKKIRVGASVVLSFALLLTTSFAYPQPAHAQLAVAEAGPNLFQNTLSALKNTITAIQSTVTANNSILERIRVSVLVPLAKEVAKQALKSMTHSMVNWINSGFEGSPAFETDLNNSLRRLADAKAAEFVNDLLNNTSINSPYIQQVASGIAQGYLLYTSREAIAERLRYTLDDYSPDSLAFRRGDFSQGGFNAWFAMTRTCGNDPYCVQFAAQEELVNQIDATTRQHLEELSWGKGFLSWKNCPKKAESGHSADGTSLSDAKSNKGCTISTPGSAIVNSFQKVVDIPIDELLLADSIDEIASALAGQLMSQVIGGAAGLLSASEPSSDSGRSYLEQSSLQNDTPSYLADGFIQAAEMERSKITTNRTAWETFRPLASQAVQTCTGGINNPTQTAEASSALAQADAMLLRGASSVTTLTDIIKRANDITAKTLQNESALTQQVVTDYNRVLTSGGVDAPDDALSARMTAIISEGCD